MVRTVFLLLPFTLFIFGCPASLLLAQAFSGCGERGLLSAAVCSLLTEVASLV